MLISKLAAGGQLPTSPETGGGLSAAGALIQLGSKSLPISSSAALAASIHTGTTPEPRLGWSLAVFNQVGDKLDPKSAGNAESTTGASTRTE